MSDLDLLVRFEDETMAGLSPATIQQRQGAVLRFAAWLAPRTLVEASTGDITGWLDELGVSAKTRSDRVSGLHRFYNWCLNAELIDRDPAAPLIRIRRPVNAGDFPDIARQWWIAQERKALSPSTIQKRALELRLLLEWIAPKSVLDVSTVEVELWLDARRLSPKGRYAALSHLHMFFTWARRNGLASVDPTEPIDRPRLPVAVPRPISDEDLAVALDRADTTMRAMLLLAALAGFRAKEIAGLRRADILEQFDPPVLIVTAPKGRRQRTVPLHGDLRDALRAVLPKGAADYLFTVTGDVRPLPAWKVSQMANDHLHSLGISSTLHQLRHHFATKVYGSCSDLRLTQELLGHASPTTTAIYTAYARGKASDVVAGLAVPMTASASMVGL